MRQGRELITVSLVYLASVVAASQNLKRGDSIPGTFKTPFSTTISDASMYFLQHPFRTLPVEATLKQSTPMFRLQKRSPMFEGEHPSYSVLSEHHNSMDIDNPISDVNVDQSVKEPFHPEWKYKFPELEEVQQKVDQLHKELHQAEKEGDAKKVEKVEKKMDIASARFAAIVRENADAAKIVAAHHTGKAKKNFAMMGDKWDQSHPAFPSYFKNWDKATSWEQKAREWQASTRMRKALAREAASEDEPSEME